MKIAMPIITQRECGYEQSGVPPCEPLSEVRLVRQGCYAGSCRKRRQRYCDQPVLRRPEVPVAISGEVRAYLRRMRSPALSVSLNSASMVNP